MVAGQAPATLNSMALLQAYLLKELDEVRALLGHVAKPARDLAVGIISFGTVTPSNFGKAHLLSVGFFPRQCVLGMSQL